MKFFVIVPTVAAALYEAFVVTRVYRLIRRNYSTKPLGCYAARAPKDVTGRLTP